MYGNVTLGKLKYTRMVCVSMQYLILHIFFTNCVFHTLYLELRKQDLKYFLVTDIISINTYFGGQDHI